MKKLLYFGLSASLFLSALTGCGSTAGTAAADTSEVSIGAEAENTAIEETEAEGTSDTDSGEAPFRRGPR